MHTIHRSLLAVLLAWSATTALAVTYQDPSNTALEDIVDVTGAEVTIAGGNITVDIIVRNIPAAVPTNTLRLPPTNGAFNINLTERVWQVVFDIDGSGGNSAGDLVLSASTASNASQPEGSAPLDSLLGASRRVFTTSGTASLGGVQRAVIGNRLRLIQPATAEFAAVTTATPFRITTYRALVNPQTNQISDGVRDLAPKTGGYFTPNGPTTGAFIYRLFNTGLSHYFITADHNEVDAILAGAAGPGWTDLTQMAGTGGSRTVCRFYGDQAHGGPNGHFYTADTAECAAVKTDPGWHFESLDFRTTAASGGQCPAGLQPIYRAYNNRFAFHDSNHFYSANLIEYNNKLAQGWLGEGAVFCGNLLFGPAD